MSKVNPPSLPGSVRVRADGSLIEPDAHDAELVAVEYGAEGEVSLALREVSGRQSRVVARGVLTMNLSYLSRRNVLFNIIIKDAVGLSAEEESLADRALEDIDSGWRVHMKRGVWFVQVDPTQGIEGIIFCKSVEAYVGKNDVSATSRQ